MTHDIYCAFCGGPHRSVEVADEPQPENFKILREAAARGEDLEDDESGRDLPFNLYDPEVISEEDAAWINNVAIVGFNPSANGFDQGFVTSQGYEEGFGEVTVTNAPSLTARHMDYIEQRDNAFQCYDSYDESDDVAYPFHPSCYGVFRRRLAHRLGEDGMASVNKGVLYNVLRNTPHGHRCLNIDYGSPPPDCTDQCWTVRPGEEIFAADPGPIDGMEERVTELVASGLFANPLPTGLDVSHKVREDPFKKLPYDILLKIGGQCDSADSLVNWTTASWFAHAQLRSAGSHFWKEAVLAHMGSLFPELVACLDDGRLREGSAMRTFYHWAASRSKPRLYMQGGDFLRLANRRRIWTTPCTELVNRYCQALFPKSNETDFGQLLRTKTACGTMYKAVHDPEAQLFGDLEKCFWIDEWEDTATKSHTFEAYFREQDGWLVGITVTSEGGERRVLGSTQAEGVLLRSEAVVPVDDWVCGILLHIPSIKVVGTPLPDKGNKEKTAVKGITINCKSGLDLHLGQTDRGYAIRPLMARAGRQVVGMVVQKGISTISIPPYRSNTPPPPDTKVTPFTRIGLMTLWDTQLEEYTVLPDNVTRLRWDEMNLDNDLWESDGLRFFDAPYWNNPSLRFPNHDWCAELDRDYRDVDRQLVGQDVLLWARNADELRQLKTVSIFTTFGQDLSDSHKEKREDGEDGRPIHEYHICGLGVEFTQGHPDDRRVVGLVGKAAADARDGKGLPTLTGPRCSEGSVGKVGEMKGDGDFRIDLDIDGAGGEVITEVYYNSDSTGRPINAVKFYTNWEREAGCWLNPTDTAEERVDEDTGDSSGNWVCLLTPPGRTMVGLTACFAYGRGSSETGCRTYQELTGLTAIAMELGVEGEGTIDEDDDWYEDTEEFFPDDDEDDFPQSGEGEREGTNDADDEGEGGGSDDEGDNGGSDDENENAGSDEED